MTPPRFPPNSRPWTDIQAEMESAHKDDKPWYAPRQFKGGSYFGGEDVVQVANDAYQMYINHNALFAPDLFPSLVKYESELLDALLEMLTAPDGAGGSLTSGGTESIVVAVKAARAWARVHKPDATAPEIVVPHAAHPAFDKATHILGIKTVRIPNSVDFRADLDAMAGAINKNTILIAGSAPSYPYGVTDPISDIGALAQKHNLWCHIDACHGGYVLPFARKLGYPIPDYDFAIDGVTSISVDVHKLGYANKGVSGLLLRDEALVEYQRFTFENWPSGLYSTRSNTGSRSGGGVASAWAVLNYLGEEGYLRIVERILDTRDRFIDGINSIEGLRVYGDPHAYLVAFGPDPQHPPSKDLDIFAVHDGMLDKGWNSNRIVDPEGIHLFFDYSHYDISEQYLTDLALVTSQVRSGNITRRQTQAVYTRS